jgi:hypothetical protein
MRLLAERTSTIPTKISTGLQDRQCVSYLGGPLNNIAKFYLDWVGRQGEAKRLAGRFLPGI